VRAGLLPGVGGGGVDARGGDHETFGGTACGEQEGGREEGEEQNRHLSGSILLFLAAQKFGW